MNRCRSRTAPWRAGHSPREHRIVNIAAAYKDACEQMRASRDEAICALGMLVNLCAAEEADEIPAGVPDEIIIAQHLAKAMQRSRLEPGA